MRSVNNDKKSIRSSEDPHCEPLSSPFTPRFLSPNTGGLRELKGDGDSLKDPPEQGQRVLPVLSQKAPDTLLDELPFTWQWKRNWGDCKKTHAEGGKRHRGAENCRGGGYFVPLLKSDSNFASSPAVLSLSRFEVSALLLSDGFTGGRRDETENSPFTAQTFTSGGKKRVNGSFLLE